MLKIPNHATGYLHMASRVDTHTHTQTNTNKHTHTHTVRIRMKVISRTRLVPQLILHNDIARKLQEYSISSLRNKT